MSESLESKENEETLENREEQAHKSRRDFLRKLGRWSAIIIGGAALAGTMNQSDTASGWINGRGGGGTAAWVNRAGGGGGAWVNGGGGGGASWVNRSGGWINGGGGGWINARGGWVNRY